jgi:hypothetical protein
MGIVSYANEIKNKFLNVPNEVLNTVGAVSRETAEAMARGIVDAANADIGVGITGIAGPTGGTPEKPVGLVYYSLYLRSEDKIIVEVNFDSMSFTPGGYMLGLELIYDKALAFWKDTAVSFIIEEVDFYNSGDTWHRGIVLLNQDWKVYGNK